MARVSTEEKNFNRIAKHYAKAERLHIQQQDGMVYITDGYTAVKINPTVYRCYFQVVSARYRDISEGERLCVSPTLEIRDGAQVKAIFDRRNHTTYYRKYYGKILEDQSERSAGRFMAVLEPMDSNLTDMLINFEYFKLFRDICDDRFEADSASPNTALFGRGALDTEVIMLPIRF